MNNEHNEKLKYGVKSWNTWRAELYWLTVIDLSEADISQNLPGIDFRDANLSRSKFSKVDLTRADFRDANLKYAIFENCKLILCDFRGACLDGASFINSDLTGSNLGLPDLSDKNLDRAEKHPRKPPSLFTSAKGCKFVGANLNETKSESFFAEKTNFAGAQINNASFINSNFKGANLNGASCTYTDFRNTDFCHSSLVGTNLSHSNLSKSHVYGTSAWELDLSNTIQEDLTITPKNHSPVTIDNFELAQFIFILINNKKIRDVIDTMTTRVVLILGRFSDTGKEVLDGLKAHTRSHGFVPVVFDFQKPDSRGLTESLLSIASLSKYIIADISEPRCTPHELGVIVPHLQSVVVQPICSDNVETYATFDDIKRYQSVNPIIHFNSIKQLKQMLDNVLFKNKNSATS